VALGASAADVKAVGLSGTMIAGRIIVDVQVAPSRGLTHNIRMLIDAD
jgi:hypothetical protein